MNKYKIALLRVMTSIINEKENITLITNGDLKGKDYDIDLLHDVYYSFKIKVDKYDENK